MYSARLGRLRESLALFIKHQGCRLSRRLFGNDRWARMIGPVIETTGTFGGTVKGRTARNVWSQNHCFGNAAKLPQGSTKELKDTAEMSFSDSKVVPADFEASSLKSWQSEMVNFFFFENSSPCYNKLIPTFILVFLTDKILGVSRSDI